jgi:hypothetical protein
MLSCCDSGWWKSENIKINIDDDIDDTNPSSPLGFHACLFVFFALVQKLGELLDALVQKLVQCLNQLMVPNPNPIQTRC